MERNLPPCFIILILCYNVHILGASSAYITVNPTDIRIGVNLTMSCKYNGSFTVTSLAWEKNSAGLQIRLFANCIAGNIPDSTVYNMNRTTYSCDQVNNIYSLTLNNLVAEDDGNSWSCSLSLSAGNTTDPVVYIIRLPYSTTTTSTSTATPISTTRTKYTDIGTTLSIPTTTSRTLPVTVIIGVSVGGFLSILLLLIVCCCCCKCCWFYRCRKNENTDKYEANDSGNFNNHSQSKDGTPNVPYALSNASRVSSNSNAFKQARPNPNMTEF